MNRISRDARKLILDDLVLIGSCAGGQYVAEFAKRVCPDIEEQTYQQGGRKIPIINDISRHMDSFDDWEFNYLFDTVLDLLNVSDDKFIYFCEQYVNPIFRRRRRNEDDEWIDITQECIDAINQGLSDIGLSLQPIGQVAGRTKYKVLPTNQGAQEPIKNIIFAAKYKPDIVLDDALANDIKVVNANIEERTNDLKQQRVSYIMQLEELSGTDIEKEMQELTARVQAAQQEVNELIEENKSIAQQLSEFQQKEANCRILLSRYESLISQYKADLQRLDFISKGEKAVQGVPLNDVCPFCGGKVHPEKDDTYMEAIHAEIRRIASELTVIAATVKSVQEEQAEIQGNIEELYVRRAGVNQALAEKQHAIQDYQVGLKRYRDYTTLQTGIDFVNSQLEVLGKKRVSELNPEKNPPLYHPKKEFEAEVGTNFTVLLNKILKACNYRLGGYASWDYSTFDILVDGEPKSDDQGQGYRSFLNSVVAMMLYEYFNRDGAYIKPGFLMLDTPLLGLDEDDEELDKETIRNGLYRYFIDNQGKGQVIVVDNLNAVPNINFEAEGINVITYHKNERDGHIYGFMPSWRKDIPKEAR